jgi:hypothetical protein
MLQANKLGHAVDILDLVTTEHQPSQIGEIIADIVDTG